MLLAFSKLWLVIAGLVAFLFALFFGKLSLRAIRNDWAGKEPGEKR
jgi:hypothetical protein